MATDERNPDLVEMGKLMRQRRNELQLTQEKLAEIANISWDTIQRMEAGKRGVKMDVFFHICDILGKTPFDFSPSRYINQNSNATLYNLFNQLNDSNQAFLIKQIGDTIKYLLSIQKAKD